MPVTTPLGARWLGSPNFTPGRNGHSMAVPPAYVVMHTMVACWESANARFQNPNDPAQASATYGVLLDGSIVQWVDENDAAGANGTFDRNPGSNLDSISIEHEDCGEYNGPRTPALYATSAALVRDICTRYGIPIDRQHVLLHREVSIAPTACPDSLDVDRIVATAAGQASSPPATPVKPPEDAMTIFAVGDAGGGPIFLVKDATYGPKRQVNNPAEETAYAATMSDTSVHTLPQFVLDAMETEHGYDVEDLGKLQASLDAIKATLAALPVGGGLTAAQSQQLGELAAAVTRIEGALKGA